MPLNTRVVTSLQSKRQILPKDKLSETNSLAGTTTKPIELMTTLPPAIVKRWLVKSRRQSDKRFKEFIIKFHADDVKLVKPPLAFQVLQCV